MGFKEGTTKESLAVAMAQFGKSDDVYNIMNAYEAKENECWMVRPGFVHAPGPKVTIEIQKAQGLNPIVIILLLKKLDFHSKTLINIS